MSEITTNHTTQAEAEQFNGERVTGVVIDMTPTWRETAEMLIVLLADGDAEGKRYAREEVRRMGAMIDQYIALRGKLGEYLELQRVETDADTLQHRREELREAIGVKP